MQALNTTQKYGKDIGNLPADLRRSLEKLITVKTDWKHYLSIFAQTVAMEDKESTWKKCNRRFGLLAPGSRLQYRPKLLVVLDNSGSTYSVYDAFIAHICRISTYMDVTAIGVDTTVNFEFEFKKGKKPPTFEDIKSGGGTRFQPAFDYAKKKHFDGIIYLTDGDNYDEGTLNTYHIPTIFALCPDGTKKPGRRNIVIDVENEG
jgi:predicted metal-dependent peptidase